ncbi:ribonuclease H-like domain-containing protein [Lagierella sp.]|uniref:ribonuclease H-like domain-containing protein n=1 Tax=Lagierella sp. TaxID=2849657 RepID=UPI002619A950|nr:ribonuclease H-like domain-containing protein [Lagierella sp.]
MRRKKVVNNLSVTQSVLTITTTGIDRNKNHIFLVTLLTGGADGQLIQYQFPEDQDAFLEDIRKKPNLITFNGHSFDIPFLEKHFALSNFLKEDLDIYKFLKGYKFIKLENYKFTTVFEYFTKEKFEELTGRQTVKLIKEYEKENSPTVLQKIYKHGEDHCLNLYRVYELVKDEIKNGSINLSIYGKDLKLLPYSFKEEKDYFNIDIINYGDKIPLSYQYKDFELVTKDENYQIKFKKVEGLLDQQTHGICIITDFKYQDEDFKKLKPGLIPIFVKDYQKEKILKAVKLSLSRIGEVK